jgi:aminopeptidase N
MRRLTGLLCSAALLATFASAALAAPASSAPAAAAPAPILASPEARDTASYGEPLKARVSDVALDLTADFQAHRLSGTATLTVDAKPGVNKIVLDTSDLTIRGVTDEHGQALPFTLGPAQPDMGAPLTVTLNGARRIVVDYATSPDAIALQWLNPAQTAGKQKPYLFSQGEPNLNRSWVPTQDSPGVRQTWSAKITAPAGLTAVMSADRLTPEGEPLPDGRRVFRFRMTHPVPPYLIALAVGDLKFQPLGPRTGVWTEPAMLDAAASEFHDAEKMVTAAEQLYGPYRWGRWDLLVLPPSFPYGGMENPTLTFVTPTIITGDRSQVDVITHELAHSWSGNLVTNATWADSWLNEGFTVYFENRITERIYGREVAMTEADLNWDELQADLKRMGPTNPATRLHGKPFETELDYVKGSEFLYTLEREVGRERFDAWLRGYFDSHAFQPQTTAGLLADIRKTLVRGDAGLEQRLRLDEWAYAPGLPANAVHVVSPQLTQVDRAAQRLLAGTPAAELDAHGWTTNLWIRFLNGLPRGMAPTQLADLDRTFSLSTTPNDEIRCAWLQLAIANRYAPALASADQFLHAQGRGKFVMPTYRALLEQKGWGDEPARRIYASARLEYHPALVSKLDKAFRGEPVAW